MFGVTNGGQAWPCGHGSEDSFRPWHLRHVLQMELLPGEDVPGHWAWLFSEVPCVCAAVTSGCSYRSLSVEGPQGSDMGKGTPEQGGSGERQLLDVRGDPARET